MKHLNRILLIAMLLFSNGVNGQAGKKQKKQKMQVVNTVSFPLKVDRTFKMYTIPQKNETPVKIIIDCCVCELGYYHWVISEPPVIKPNETIIFTRQDIQNKPANFLVKQMAMRSGIGYSERANTLIASGGRPENTTYVVDGMMIDNTTENDIVRTGVKR
jgi:hypothetical protein